MISPCSPCNGQAAGVKDAAAKDKNKKEDVPILTHPLAKFPVYLVFELALYLVITPTLFA